MKIIRNGRFIQSLKSDAFIAFIAFLPSGTLDRHFSPFTFSRTKLQRVALLSQLILHCLQSSSFSKANSRKFHSLRSDYSGKWLVHVNGEDVPRAFDGL